MTKQKDLDKECKYAKLHKIDYLRIDGPVVVCEHGTAGKIDNKWTGIKFCVCSEINFPTMEYGELCASNYIDKMNSCEYKIPLTLDIKQYKKKLEEKKEIMTYSKEMGKKIAYHGIYNVSFKDNEDLKGIISLVFLNYLNSNDYASKDFDERLVVRKDFISCVETVIKKINISLEARL